MVLEKKGPEQHGLSRAPLLVGRKTRIGTQTHIMTHILSAMKEWQSGVFIDTGDLGGRHEAVRQGFSLEGSLMLRSED